MYVYIQSEPNLYTVGFYDPSGNWHPDSDFGRREEAAKRVAYLNGGKQIVTMPNGSTIEFNRSEPADKLRGLDD